MTTEQKLAAYLDQAQADRMNEAARKMLPGIQKQCERDKPETIILPGDVFARGLSGKCDKSQNH